MQDRRRIFISGIELERIGFERKASEYTKGEMQIIYDGLTWILLNRLEPPIKIEYLDEINV